MPEAASSVVRRFILALAAAFLFVAPLGAVDKAPPYPNRAFQYDK